MIRSNHTVWVVAGLVFAIGVAAPASAQKTKRGGKPPKASQPALTVDVAAERKALFGKDVDASAAAAQKLGLSKQAGALDALLDALAMGVHPKVASAALEGLANQRDPKSIDVLLHYARNRNADVRSRAVLALGTLEDKRARAAVYDAFTDSAKEVRASAIKVAESREDKGAIETLLALMTKGDEATTEALATVGSADVARKVAELQGEAPPELVAETLGKIALRKDLGNETVYVEIVRAICRIPADEQVTTSLGAYVSTNSDKAYRQSVREAQQCYEQRLASPAAPTTTGSVGGER